MIDSIVVAWIRPSAGDIRVRGYMLGYGKGVPDTYTIELDVNRQWYTITDLGASSRTNLIKYEK